MDTNIITISVAALRVLTEKDTGTASVLIVGMVIAALAQILSSIAGYIKSREVAMATKTLKEKADKSNEILEKVHTSVNGERNMMMDKLEALTAQVLELSKNKSTLEENKRGRVNRKSNT